MKKLIYIIATIAISILLVSITNARVVYEEYVTKAEVKQYLASVSEYLEWLTSLERLTTEYFDKNPTLRFEKEENYRKREEENKKAGGN